MFYAVVLLVTLSTTPALLIMEYLNVPEPDFKFKLLLIGDTSVGKTSVLVRFANDSYQQTTLATIGKKLSVMRF